MTDINEDQIVSQKIERTNAALAASRARFVTAQNNLRQITDQDREDVDRITSAVIGLGAVIEELVPNGRNKSLALTALEDVLTRANRGIYVDRPGVYSDINVGEHPAATPR